MASVDVTTGARIAVTTVKTGGKTAAIVADNAK
jgi:hypothetical protein